MNQTRVGNRGVSRTTRSSQCRANAFILAFVISLGFIITSAHAQDTDQAFQGVQQAIEDARQMVLSEASTEGIDQAEGFRYVLRRIEHWLQSSGMDDVDTGHPRVYRCPSKVCKLGFDSPDFVYLSVAPIDDQHDYRVYGKRGSVDLITFQMNEGLGGTETMTSDDLIVDANGNWEIILSPNAQPGSRNSLFTKPAVKALLIRQIFSDWDVETEASVQIEVLGGPVPPVAPLTPDKVEVGLNRLPTDIFTIPNIFESIDDAWPTNDMNTPVPGGFGFQGAGFPDNHTSAAHYDLVPTEALIIEVDATATRFHDIQLGNIWKESLDYGSRQVSLNGSQAYLDADNKWRYVLAHTDPGVPNWLDIAGHEKGTIFMRFLIPDLADLPTAPTVSLVPLASVAGMMPAGHPTVTPAERAQTLLSRERAVNRRINPAGLGLAVAIDHFQCYGAKDLKNPKFPGAFLLSLQDQFGSSFSNAPKLETVCTPVNKNGEGISDPSQHLCCYKLKGGAKLNPAQRVETSDQFGTVQSKLKEAKTLCMPCTASPLP